MGAVFKLSLLYKVLAWAMLQQPYRYAHAWPCASLIQSLIVTHRFDFQVWPQTCLITMDSSGNCWMVSDPGYCFQTYPDPDLPTQLPGLTSGLIYHQGLVWSSGFLLNLVTITRLACLAGVLWDWTLACDATASASPVVTLGSCLHLLLSDRSNWSLPWLKEGSA